MKPLLFFIAFLISHAIVGQNKIHQFHHLNYERGLVAGTNNNFIFRDSRANVWISSIAGLHRFDGHRMKLFHQGSRPEDLLTEIASWSALHEDERGDIWFTLGKGLTRFNYQDETFSHFTVQAKGKEIRSHYTWSWLDVATDSLYFGAGDYLFVTDTKTPELAELVDTVRVNYKARMYALGTGVVRLLRIIPGAGQLVFSEYNDGAPISEIKRYELGNGLELNDAIGYGDNMIIVATNRGLKIFDVRSEKWSTLKMPREYAETSPLELEILRDQLYVGTAFSGIHVFDLSRRKYLTGLFEAATTGPRLFKQRLARLFIDRSETLWVSTLNDGVYYTDLRASKLGFKAAPKGTALPVVDVLRGSKNELITLYFDRYTVELNDRNTSYEIPEVGNSELAEPTFLFQDRTERLFLGTYDQLYVADCIGCAFEAKHLVPGAPYRKSFGYNSIQQLDSGDFIFCINDSVPIIVSEDLALSRDLLPGLNRPRKVVFGEESGVVLTYIDSLHVISGGKNMPSRDTVFVDQPLATEAVYDAINGGYWIATLNGLYRLYTTTVSSRWVLEKVDAIEGGNIMGMEWDSSGKLWLSGSNGILCFDPVSNEVIKLSLTDGIQGAAFVLDASLYDNDGVLYFGGSNGVTTLKPEDAQPTIPPPEVRIVNVRVNGSANKIGALQHLSYRENNLEIELANGDFSDPLRNIFYYSVDGGSVKDTLTARGAQISLTRLAPGSYELSIWSENADGVLDSSPLLLPITILPPWQRTWWAYTLYVLTALGVISAYFWQVLSKEREKSARAQAEAEVAETETSVLRLQMNPHFIFNSLNSIDDYILDEAPLKAHDYLLVFSELMRDILNRSTQPLTRLDREIAMLEKYVAAERMRIGDGLRFRVEQGEEVDLIFTWVPTMILQPFVENAIWHGIGDRQRGGTITLRLNIAEGEELLRVGIEDDGRGRGNAVVRTKGHASKALSITQKRLDLLNAKMDLALQQNPAPAAAPTPASFEVQDLTHPDGKPAGTCVVLYLPLIYPEHDESSSY